MYQPGGTVADVELIRFGATTTAITTFASESFALGAIVRAHGGAVARLASPAPGGRIEGRPAADPPPLAVVPGMADRFGAAGQDGEVGPGEAALGQAGETDETWASEGLAAVVVEGSALEPVAPVER